MASRGFHRVGRLRGGRALVGLLLLAASAAGAPAGSPPLAETERALPSAATTDPSLGSPALPVPAPSRVEQAWRGPAPDLAQRVARTRRTALELGAWSFDPAARVLAGQSGLASLERAEAAVELAPDLPAARMRLAQARWLQDGAPIAAVRTALGALLAIPRHAEASLWFAGSALYLLAVALVAGGLLAIALAALVALPHAAHDLGHALPGRAPGFAGFAALAALLLFPVALGEGALGLALALLAVAVVCGGREQRIAMALAIACTGLGAFPLARLAGTALAALPEDPVARSAFALGHGLATPVDLARLETVGERDDLAARGLALYARRTGSLAEADAWYQRLLESHADDPALLNNAANVRLELGHRERALELYRRAVELEESPVFLFNLAQAYGRAFQVEDLNRTLARAQDLGGDFIGELTTLQGSETRGLVVDVPLAPRLLWRRALQRDAGRAVAAELRAPLAPGRLGRDVQVFAAASGAVVLLGAVVGGRLRRSRACPRCGQRICPRCAPGGAGGELCEACHRLFFQPEKTDRTLRIERVTQLRRREERMSRLADGLAVLVPGAAGLVARRPLFSLAGALCFAVAGTAAIGRAGVVPDPLVAGAAAPTLFVGTAVLAALAYTLVVTLCLAARRRL